MVRINLAKKKSSVKKFRRNRKSKLSIFGVKLKSALKSNAEDLFWLTAFIGTIIVGATIL